MDYSYLYANEVCFNDLRYLNCILVIYIIEHLKNQSLDSNILAIFLNLVQIYQSNERT
jgi:hypothetical protein